MHCLRRFSVMIAIIVASPSFGQESTPPVARDTDFFESEPVEGSVESLRTQYAALDGRAKELAEQLRSLVKQSNVDRKKQTELRESLQSVVQQAFQIQQQMQRAEIVEFTRRLQRLQQSVASRESIAEKIVEHRIQELLDPNLPWVPTDGSSSLTPNVATTTPTEPRMMDRGSTTPVQVNLTCSREFQIKWERAPRGPVARGGVHVQFGVPWEKPFDFQLHQIAGRHGLEILATIETASDNSEVPSMLPTRSFPLQVTDEDMEHVIAGQKITKAIYLAIDPDSPAADDIRTIVSSKLDPGIDPVEVAQRSGVLVAVVRLSARPRVIRPVADASELDGKWKLVSLKFVSLNPGLPNPMTQILSQRIGSKVMTLEIQGNRWTTFLPGEQERPLTVTYDLAASPQKVWWTTKFGDRTVPRQQLFEVDGETLYVAQFSSSQHAADELESFDTPGTIISTYQRAVSPADDKSLSATDAEVTVDGWTRPTISNVEKAIAKLVLVFFQDKSRRSAPALVVKGANGTLAITVGPATIVPDGTPPAVDGSFLEISGMPPVQVAYDNRSETDLHAYVTGGKLPSFALTETASVKVGDRLWALPVDQSLSPMHPNVVAVGQESELDLPQRGIHHHYENLIEVDLSLPEGTLLFRDGKLAGMTLLGTRFLSGKTPKSYVIPAARIVEFCAKFHSQIPGLE